MSKSIDRSKIKRKLYILAKEIYFTSKPRVLDTRPIFIMGSGRSGTTLLMNIFHHDLRMHCFGENDKRIAHDFMIDEAKLDSLIKKSASKYVVCKPILNSFDAYKFLHHYETSKIIWMVRHYKDVIASSKKKFGMNTKRLLLDTLNDRKSRNWIAYGIHDSSYNALKRITSEHLHHNDYLGLIWYCVNYTIFEENLADHHRVKIMQYEHLVQDVEAKLKDLYRFIGLPEKRTGLKVYTQSIKKGKDILLSPQVEELCQSLYTRIASL